MKRVSMSFYLAFALTQIFGQVTTKTNELNNFAAHQATEFKAKKAEAILEQTADVV